MAGRWVSQMGPMKEPQMGGCVEGAADGESLSAAEGTTLGSADGALDGLVDGAADGSTVKSTRIESPRNSMCWLKRWYSTEQCVSASSRMPQFSYEVMV